ncbi:bZIP transcription factor [Colletotrichum karsti]|uniref:BZIP transcription factor n=1 Tax=Colletotrichum karsti TaxID=1095194 RepID=A0A9P6I1U5_9PEZI|nr:bZIP transcription factor [Colletotrichum karsti]KAF9872481.1 bZIP transcription factor [Colletotrichum karsti]
MSQQESNGRIASLMDQLSEMTRHRDSLVKVLSSIETSIQVHHKGERVGTTTGPDQAPQTHNETTTFQHWPADHVTSDTPAIDVEDVALDVFAPPGTMTWDVPVSDTADQAVAETTGFTSSLPAADSFPLPGDPDLEPFLSGHPLSARQTHQGDGVIVPEPDSACECLGSRQDPGSPGFSAAASIWRCANEVLGGRKMLPRNVLDMEDDMSDDIPVRVILEGWEAVERSGRLPPLWKKLRRTDSLQFRDCPDTERLAILRLMHQLLRYQAEPTIEQCAKLPAWYLSR